MTEEKTYAVCFVCKKIFAGEDINKHTRPMVINNATETDICDACYGALTTHNRYAGRIYKGTPVVQDNVFVKNVVGQSQHSAQIILSKKAVDRRKRAVVILLDNKDD